MGSYPTLRTREDVRRHLEELSQKHRNELPTVRALRRLGHAHDARGSRLLVPSVLLSLRPGGDREITEHDGIHDKHSDGSGFGAARIQGCPVKQKSSSALALSSLDTVARCCRSTLLNHRLLQSPSYGARQKDKVAGLSAAVCSGPMTGNPLMQRTATQTAKKFTPPLQRITPRALLPCEVRDHLYSNSSDALKSQRHNATSVSGICCRYGIGTDRHARMLPEGSMFVERKS